MFNVVVWFAIQRVQSKPYLSQRVCYCIRAKYTIECGFITAYTSMNLLLFESFSATVASRGAFEFNGRITAGVCDGVSLDGVSFGIE